MTLILKSTAIFGQNWKINIALPRYSNISSLVKATSSPQRLIKINQMETLLAGG